MKICKTVGLQLAFVCAFTALSAAQTYTITKIGALSGDNESSGFWVNNLGDVSSVAPTRRPSKAILAPVWFPASTRSCGARAEA